MYQAMGYTAPFSPGDKQKAVDSINAAQDLEAMQAIIPKKYCAKVLAHKSNNGPFEVLEQLLDIKGIETNNLEKMMTKILRAPLDQEEKQSKHLNRILSGFTPKLTDQEEFKSVTGLKFNLSNISYAHFENQELVECRRFKLENEINAKTAFETLNLLLQSEEIVNELPQSDVIICETNPKIVPNDKILSVKMNTNLLEASIFARLDSRTPRPTLYTFQYAKLSSLFNLDRLGHERMKIHPQLPSILDQVNQQRKTMNLNELLQHDEKVKEFFQARGMLDQESIAFLCGLAFLHMYDYVHNK